MRRTLRPLTRLRSVEVEVQPRGQVDSGVADLDVLAALLLGEADRSGTLCRQVHLCDAGVAVVVHLVGGVLVLVGEPLVTHVPTVGATEG